ncbi:MAG: rhodanese family protein [Planctomycetota bacterium]|nr:rhodanese family protein [Planctomycetota bacterium]
MATMQSNPMVPRGAADNMGRGGMPAGERGLVSMSPKDAQAAMSRGEAVLLDVREPDEFAHERIAGATLLPLSKFDAAAALALAKPNQRLIVQCKSGKRATDACQRILPLESAGNVVLLTGGIEGWKAAGLPTVLGTGTSGISIMRQVQLVVGVLSLVGSVLAWFVHPAFVGIPAFLGAGLTFAGATGTCALATILGMMPWNKGFGASSGVRSASGACCKL